MTNHCCSRVRMIIRKALKVILYFDPSKYIFNLYLLVFYCQENDRLWFFKENFCPFVKSTKITRVLSSHLCSWLTPHPVYYV